MVTQYVGQSDSFFTRLPLQGLLFTIAMWGLLVTAGTSRH